MNLQENIQRIQEMMGVINLFGSNENEITNNDFSDLGKKLENNINNVQDVKLLFNYLDAII